jgi:Zn-dependent M28 family amino/carboxypeptidase
MARIRVEAKFEPVGGTSNVIGLLKGSDPKLKNEYIVVGAHMDHVGIQGKDIIFPGGNDNASGVASLIGVARAFADSGIKPKRSIIFVAFTGEEMGLKGSKYFVDHMGVRKDKVKAMVNFDMVGDGTNLMTFSKEYPFITKAVQKANRNLHNLEIIVGPSGHGSDHVSFVEAGIPATMLLTDGEWGYPYHHTHYHYEDWMMSMDNWKKATDTALLATWYLAN